MVSAVSVRIFVLPRAPSATETRAMVVLELYHLKWIWLSEWSCRKCAKRNLDCGCQGRWVRYL